MAFQPAGNDVEGECMQMSWCAAFIDWFLSTEMPSLFTTGVLTYYINGVRIDVTGLISRIFKTGSATNVRLGRACSM